MTSPDTNQSAANMVAEITGQPAPEGVYEGLLRRRAAKDANAKKNPAAVALGRLGGKKGGAARAAVLSPEERKRIAAEAAEKRWRFHGLNKEEIEYQNWLGRNLSRLQISQLMNKTEEEISSIAQSLAAKTIAREEKRAKRRKSPIV